MTIRSELETILIDWAAAHSPVIPVALEGCPFNKPTNGTYVQAFLMPASTTNPSVDGRTTREIGIFQINVWGLDGRGCGEVESLAEEIVGLYPIIPKVGTVSIEQTPSKTTPMIESGWRVVPVTIRYRQ